jgi:signal transduction histidine kinase
VSSGLLASLPLAIAFLAARSYVRQGFRVFLLFGGGMIAIGMGYALAGWGSPNYGMNFAHTLYGIGVLLGGFYHLIGVFFLTFGSATKLQPPRPRAASTCITFYLATTLVLLVTSLFTIKGFLPISSSAEGLSLFMQIILTLAGIAYLLSAVLLVALHAQTLMKFLSLYSNGLFLMALGIGTLLSQGKDDSLLSWAGTVSRYVAGLYFVAAMLAGIRETRLQGTSLPDYLSELFRLHLDDQVKVRTKALVETNKKLELSRLEMRNLAAHLLLVREEERRKVAQEIHDTLGQTLVALKMDLHWLAKRLGRDVAYLHEKIAGTIGLSEEAINTVRRIASDLRPRILDDLGLEPALDWLCADFRRQTNITCKVITDLPTGVVGRNAAMVLYGFIQEALANVRRHSEASYATVRLSVADGMLNLIVEDDGIGITAQQTVAPNSYGLIGLRERVEELGGDLSIKGESGFGTILLACIPLPNHGGLE